MNLRHLGHFARASLPLPDLWRRPFERTTNWRMAPLWSRHHWQSCQSVAEATAKVVIMRMEDTFNINLYVETVNYFLGWQQLRCVMCSLIFWNLDFWVWVTVIFQKLWNIIWKTCDCVCVKIYLIWWRFTHVVAKSLGGSILTHSIISLV